MRSTLHLALACTWVLAACSSNGGADVAELDSRQDLTETAAPVCQRFKVVGQPCDDDCECLGSMCLLNEYAPFRFCTKSCQDATAGSPCAPEVEGGKWTSMCVKFPAKEFLVEPSQFCAPLCQDLDDCAALGAPWETCQPPTWLGNPLYPGVPDKVCISPSAQGHTPVNPETCDNWEELYVEFGLERTTCAAYCEFLQTCQLLAAETSLSCCAFHCTRTMVPDGKVDKAYFQEIRCYVDTYNGFLNTALVCTQPQEQCGADPDQP
jgi:hypothetical protein